MNTKIEYMYRDAANYKIFLYEIVSGEIGKETIDRLDEFADLDMFYPERVGFRADTFVTQGYQPYDDDPDFHEIVGFEETTDLPTVNMTAEEFANAVKNGACAPRWSTSSDTAADGSVCWTAKQPFIPGIVGGGDTEEEAVAEAEHNRRVFLELEQEENGHA